MLNESILSKNEEGLLERIKELEKRLTVVENKVHEWIDKRRFL